MPNASGQLESRIFKGALADESEFLVISISSVDGKAIAELLAEFEI